MIEINAVYKKTLFSSNDNSYKVALVINELTNEEVVISGSFAELIKDSSYKIKCEETIHKKYGKQYVVQTVELNINSKQAIVDYLSSNIFHGIGIKAATLVYEKLGMNCLELIVNDKKILNEVPLSNNQKEEIYLKLTTNRELEKLHLSLYDKGLTHSMINELYEKHLDKTLDYIYENPYELIFIFNNYGFDQADKLALSLNFDLNSLKRIEALIHYSLKNESNDGKCYSFKEELYQIVIELGKIEELLINTYESALNNLEKREIIVIENDKLYLKMIHTAEVDTSNYVDFVCNKKSKYNLQLINELIEDYEKNSNLELSIMQQAAIKNALTNKFSVITGGPGSGKTTITKVMVELYAALNNCSILDDKAILNIKVLAPTGKAAKRLRETTNFPAETIHKALGYETDGGFVHNEFNKLNAQLIIIDEVSMIDLLLFQNLIKAISSNAIVVLIGDNNQLPSIACGDILNDLITSNCVTVTTLDTIYRQKSNSGIIELAKQVNEGNVDKKLFEEYSDIHFIESSTDDITSYILRYINKAINLGYSLFEDISVLVPMYKGLIGIDYLNKVISDTFNTNYSFSIEHKFVTYKENDKVIQLVNDNELQIYNGDIGRINKKILINENNTTKEKIRIIFDNLMINYQINQLENINLAYATSVHKSQGSEYSVVILPISKLHTYMLRRKLIYTAITRAKEKLILIGDYNTFVKSITKTIDLRVSGLKERIINLNKQ